MMKLYLVSRVPCEHGGRLHEPLGVALTEADAVAMCSDKQDVIIELEAGKTYAPGQEIPGGVRCLMPLCPNFDGWLTAKGLALAERTTLPQDATK